MHRALLVISLLAASSVGCSDSEGPSNVPVTEAGPTDSGRDTGKPDTSVADTGTVVTDTRSDTSTTTCNAHAGDECNLVKQDCADVAASCVYDSKSKHNVCAKVTTGTKLKGESCSMSAECDRGLSCYQGACAPACCNGDDTPCGSNGACKLAITDPDSGAVVHYACSYSPPCNPFKYNCPSGMVCLYDDPPDVFRCSAPSGGMGALGAAPGVACKYNNDCGESQACFKLTTGGDAAGASEKCYLFCWLMTPAGFTPGTMPGGRFPADGTCTIKGVNYGTCSAVGGIAGGLGVCVK